MLLNAIALIDAANRRVGHTVAWLVLAMVAVQFAVVVLRYVFAIGFVWMQESVLYLYGTMFMLGVGYTLLGDGHVRVDVFYRDAEPRTRAFIDLLGSMLFVLPLCGLVLWFSWDYVLSSWAVGETSGEAFGLPLAFVYKTVIWVFALVLGAQGLSLALKCAAFLCGRAESYPFASDTEGAVAEAPQTPHR